MRRKLAAFLAASDADAITLTPEALRFVATMAALLTLFLLWCATTAHIA